MGSDELWRWWEEQDAPGLGDLYPDPDNSGCVAVLAVVTFLLVTVLLIVWLLTR